MPGKVEMSRSSTRQQNNCSKDMAEENLEDVYVSGIYHNESLLNCLAHIQGCEVTLKTQDGTVFQGIFNTVSAQSELALSYVHEVKSGEEELLPMKSQVIDKMVFNFENVVTVSAVSDLDSVSYRGAGGFATDGEISRGTFNGDVEDRNLVEWQPDHEDVQVSLESPPHLHQEHQSPVSNQSGWSINEMFRKNEEIGVVSTYKEDMSQYTTVSIDKDDGSFEYQEKVKKAEFIAREIESNPTSKRNQALENEDDERDLMGFGGNPNRGAGSPGSGQRFQQVSHGRNRASRGPRGPPMNQRPDTKNIQQLTFTASNRRGAGGSGSGFYHNSLPRSAGPQQRFSHERSPGGSADDQDWRQVRNKNSRRSESQVATVGGPVPPSQQVMHSETLPRTNRQSSHRDKQVVKELKEFSTSFKLVPSGGERQGSSSGQQLQRQSFSTDNQGAVSSFQEAGNQNRELPHPPQTSRQQSLSEQVSTNLESPNVQQTGVQPMASPSASESSSADFAKAGVQSVVQRSPGGGQPNQGASHAPPPPGSVVQQESPVNIPAQAPLHEKTPDATTFNREMENAPGANKKFTFNPDAPTFTPRTVQPPSPAMTPTTPIQQQQPTQMPAGQPLVQGGLPLYPAQAQSPPAPVQPTQMAVYAAAAGSVPGGIMAVPSQAPNAYYQQSGVSVGFQHQQIQYSLAYSAPPPTVPVGTVSQVPRNRRPNAPAVVQPATIVGQPLMATAPQQYGATAPTQQQQAQHYQMIQQYQVGIQSGAFPTQTPLVGPGGRVMQAGPQYIVQQQDGSQSLYGIPQGLSGSGPLIQQQGNQMVPPSSVMSHPPPSSSNNSGASHSNNASQPATPGPQANPSPAPFASSTPQSPQYSCYGNAGQGLYYLQMAAQPHSQVQYIPLSAAYSAMPAQLTAASQYPAAAGHPGVAQLQMNPAAGLMGQDAAFAAQQHNIAQVVPHPVAVRPPGTFLTAQPVQPAHPSQVPPPVHHSQASNN